MSWVKTLNVSSATSGLKAATCCLTAADSHTSCWRRRVRPVGAALHRRTRTGWSVAAVTSLHCFSLCVVENGFNETMSSRKVSVFTVVIFTLFESIHTQGGGVSFWTNEIAGTDQLLDFCTFKWIVAKSMWTPRTKLVSSDQVSPLWSRLCSLTASTCFCWWSLVSVWISS